MRISAAVLLALLVATATGFAQVGEAPMLEARVASGELPPVADRLPDDPLVVESVEGMDLEIGTYGGQINVVHIGSWIGNDAWRSSGTEPQLRIAPDQSNLAPGVIRSWEWSEDGTTMTAHLRAGMKWSDGAPFTADDYLFWYEDRLLNEELTPSVPGNFRPGGEPMVMEKVDDTTVRFRFAVPYRSMFSTLLVGPDGAINYVRPKHYLSQFHISHNEDANDDAKQAGFDTWVQLYNERDKQFVSVNRGNLDLPVINGFNLMELGTDVFVYERNPYFWQVDAAGNQLPYVDRIVSRKIENLEVYYGKIIGGEVDFAGGENWVHNFNQFPLLKEYEESGNYRVVLRKATQNSPIYKLNRTTPNEQVVGLFNDVRFRRALSVAIDRDEINEVIYFGTTVPAQLTAHPTSRLWTEENERAWAQHDPELANELLDEIGLQWDSSGKFRLGADDKPITFQLEIPAWEGQQIVDLHQIVIEAWQELGLVATIKTWGQDVYYQRGGSNQWDVWASGSSGTSDWRFMIDPGGFICPGPGNYCGDYGIWFRSDGAEGPEPPQEFQDAWDHYQAMKQSANDEEYVRHGSAIMAWQADQINAIGTVSQHPVVLIFRNNLKNVQLDPKHHGWDFAYTTPFFPVAWFLEPPLMPTQEVQ